METNGYMTIGVSRAKRSTLSKNEGGGGEQQLTVQK